MSQRSVYDLHTAAEILIMKDMQSYLESTCLNIISRFESLPRPFETSSILLNGLAYGSSSHKEYLLFIMALCE